MVTGLDRFSRHFARYTDQYVLIGGTACTLIMQEAGLDFRATKDLDSLKSIFSPISFQHIVRVFISGLRAIPPVRRRAPHFSSVRKPNFWLSSSAKKKLPKGELFNCRRPDSNQHFVAKSRF